MTTKNRVQSIIDAALNEQALECYEALNATMAEKLSGPIAQIAESVSKGFFEEEAKTGTYGGRKYKMLHPKLTTKDKIKIFARGLIGKSTKIDSVPKRTYESLDPQVQRGVDFVVEGVAKHGVSSFGGLVEKAEERFAIYDDSLKNYFAGEIKESHKVGDIVVANSGPHKGQKHKVIHVHSDGKLNITPLSRKNLYRQGAASAHSHEVTSVHESSVVSAIKDHMVGKAADKAAVDAVFGPRKKKTARQRKAGKAFITRKY